MKYVLVTPPEEEPITVDEAKLAARIDGTGEDTLLQTWLSAARCEIDGASGILGRAICTQTWDITYRQFYRRMDLPLPPLQSVTSITYLDPHGDDQVLPDTEYRVINGGHGVSSIVPINGWPTALVDGGAVTIRIVCGYGDAADVPQLIKTWLLARVAGWYEQRSDISIGMPVSISPNIRRMLDPYRVIFDEGSL